MIRITSDSTCDLTPELLARYQIEILPLYISMGGNVLRDNVEVTAQDMFRHVDAGGALCTTAAVNPADYEACFARLAPESEAVIHFCIGSGFSSCCQNARLAAEGFDNVYVIDSRNLSTGQGYLVLHAAERAAEGASAQDILAEISEMIPRMETSFLLDRLDYMAKGGRCSSVAAFGANLLKLKLCIDLRGGAMQAGKKYRGTMEKAIAEYGRDRLEGRSDICPERVFITHSNAEASVIEAAYAAVRTYLPDAEIIETKAGCTVSGHCGPNTLGILFCRK